MQPCVEKIEHALAELFLHAQIPQEVKSAMWYSLSAGGKRMRPMLLLCFCRAFGADAELAMPYACAMEMIHTYSLIHDDLPAMDNDDLRRGRATCHKVHGEAMALLAGDGLLNFAYETMLEAVLRDGERGVQAMRLIARGAGVSGMIAGQCMDLSAERGAADYPIDRIHEAKTGALIRAACMAGAVLGGADDKGLDAARRYGEALGLAFQITDDILDVVGDEKTLGKPIGSDEKNDKQTFVTRYGLQEARRLAAEALERAETALDAISGDVQYMRTLSQKMLTRQA